MTTAHERLGKLFLEAVDLDAAARTELIARVRTEDADLAAKLVALLAADSDVATALRDTLAGAGESSALPGVPVIPGFRVLGLIGEGGMGAVYAGEQDAPRRPVAIKVLHTRSSNARTRFVAEAEIMARLDHPGIARVLGAGEAAGQLYLAMERVDGVTLDAHLRTSRPLAERLALFAAICDAVHHAHQKGVIHRDLKPSNVMVRTDGRVAVLDFGVARLVRSDTGDGETRAGELIGTPLYMSPEQARLRPDEVDARSDVYSLGVMFYELCCGALPYDVRGKNLPAVTRAICDDEPRRLGTREPALRGNLDAIGVRTLAKQPDDRYHSAAALADDVRRHLAGHAVLARTPSAVEQLVRFARRRPAAAATAVAAAAATIAFAAIVTVLWFDAKRARDQLVVRNDETLLREARAEVARDPAVALQALGELSSGADRWRAWAIGDEALGRGVPTDIVHAHSSEVRWLEPIGDAIVSAGFDNHARLWPSLRAPARDLVSWTGAVHVARPRPDGRAIAVGGDGGLLRIVDLDGNALAELAGHHGEVKRAAWSPDGAWLATGDNRGGMWLWPHGAAPGRELGTGHDDIESIAFAADGSALVAGDTGGNLWLWPTDGGARRDVASGFGSVLAVWTDGKSVAGITADGHLLRSRDGGALLTTDLGIRLRHAAFGPDGTWAVVAGSDGTVLRVDNDTAVRIGELVGHVRVAVSDDGRRFVAAGDRGDVLLWDRTTGRALRLRGHDDRVRALAFARAGSVLLTGDGEGIVRRWELDAMLPSVLAGEAASDRIATSGNRIVAVDRNGAAWSWSADGARKKLGADSGTITAFAPWRDGAVLGDSSGTVRAWGTSASTQQLDGGVTALATTDDGVIAAASATEISILGGATIAAHNVTTLAFEPHGQWLAGAGKDGIVRVWRPSGELAATLPGPTNNTRVVVTSADHLAAGGDDGAVRIWNGIDPSSLRVVAEHPGGVTALAFDPTGRWLVSSGRDHRLARYAIDGAARSVSVRGAIVSLAVAPDGSVLATTQQHELVRWPQGAAEPAITDDSALAIAYVAGPTPHWAAALADGAIVLWQVDPPPLAKLPAAPALR